MIKKFLICLCRFALTLTKIFIKMQTTDSPAVFNEDDSCDEDKLNIVVRSSDKPQPQWRKYKYIIIIIIIVFSLLIVRALRLYMSSDLENTLPVLSINPVEFDPKYSDPSTVSNMPLTTLCASTNWRKNLYLNCTSVAKNKYGITVSSQMGATNLKAMIMSCVRFAIDAGMNMIIPKAPIRVESDPGQFNQWTEITYLIDEDHLKKSLKTECPQLNLYDADLEISNRLLKPGANYIPPPSVGKGEYKSKIDEVLKTNNIDPADVTVPTVIYDNEAMFGWKFNTEPAIRQSLRNAVKYQDRLLSLGRRIANLIKGDYIGFHLRVENGWEHDDYVSSTQYFVKTILRKFPTIKNIYVAVGDINFENRFREDMHKQGFLVLSKWEIAFRNQDILNDLTSLTFDQRAVVEQEILERSYYFYGNGYSSLAYIIADNRGKGDLKNCQCELVYGFYFAFKCCM